MRDGVLISLVGLSLTFAALGLLIGTIVALKRLFPAERGPAPEPEAVPAESEAAEAQADEIAAAIAAALAHWQASGTDYGKLGQALESGRGPWWRP